MKSFESLHKQMLKELHSQKNKPVFEQVLAVIASHSEEIVIYFYRQLLNNTAAIKFLNHDAVKTRVRITLTRWLIDTFTYHATLEELDCYYQYQCKIGHVHARIDLPMSLTHYGMNIIKSEVLITLKNSILERDALADAMILAAQMLDWALVVIDESYEQDMVINEKNVQSLKMHISAHNLAFDYERLCISLSEWMRNLLLLIAQNKYDASEQSTIRHSNFGLWISHKAHLFLTGRPELPLLVTLLDNIDEEMRALATFTRQKNEAAVEETLNRLNVVVSKSIWILSNLAKDVIDEENGRDPLTHLFNRRYLETVMRHETNYSLEHGILFGVLMIDIDFFKRINDIYGYENGDHILEQLAEIFIQQVRAGDFVFRLGSENFLIVLADVDQIVIFRVAEKIRSIVEKFKFGLNDKTITVSITVSLGTAIHNRHPDFNYTIELADEALAFAKESGRNKVVVATQSPATYGTI